MALGFFIPIYPIFYLRGTILQRLTHQVGRNSAAAAAQAFAQTVDNPIDPMSFDLFCNLSGHMEPNKSSSWGLHGCRQLCVYMRGDIDVRIWVKLQTV